MQVISALYYAVWSFKWFVKKSIVTILPIRTFDISRTFQLHSSNKSVALAIGYPEQLVQVFLLCCSSQVASSCVTFGSIKGELWHVLHH